MATAKGLISLQFVDANPVTTATDIPIVYDDATTTLAQLLAACATVITDADAITDAAIRKAKLVLNVTLPGGIKGTANAHSNNSETGLFQWNVNGSVNRYGQDIPAILPTLLSGSDIPAPSPGPVLDWENLMVSTVTGGIKFTDRYSNQLFTIFRSKKVVRTHRRALSRA